MRKILINYSIKTFEKLKKISFFIDQNGLPPWGIRESAEGSSVPETWMTGFSRWSPVFSCVMSLPYQS